MQHLKELLRKTLALTNKKELEKTYAQSEEQRELLKSKGITRNNNERALLTLAFHHSFFNLYTIVGKAFLRIFTGSLENTIIKLISYGKKISALVYLAPATVLRKKNNRLIN